MKDSWEESVKQNPAPSALLLFLLLTVCNRWVMVGAPAAVWGYKVTWKLEAMLQRCGAEKRQSLVLCDFMVLLYQFSVVCCLSLTSFT